MSLEGKPCLEQSSWRSSCWRITSTLQFLFEVGVGAPVPSHLHRKAGHSEARSTGDLWRRFFDACDSKPQCITRVRRSHLTSKELDIGCFTHFDARGNTFPVEMERAGRQR